MPQALRRIQGSSRSMDMLNLKWVKAPCTAWCGANSDRVDGTVSLVNLCYRMSSPITREVMAVTRAIAFGFSVPSDGTASRQKEHEVSGHDFTACGKTRSSSGFVSGHDLSHAAQ